MTNSSLTKHRDSHLALVKWFWGGFIAILLIGVLIALFATIRGGKQWVEATLEQANELPKSWTEVIQVTLSGEEAVYIDRTSVSHIQAKTQAWIERQRNEAQNRLLAALDQETEVIFQGALRQIPRFADWYYSLKGEYARLFYAAFDNLPDHLAQQLKQFVFQPAGTADAIDAMVNSMDAQLAAQLRQGALGLQDLLTHLVRSHRLGHDKINVHLNGQWALGDQLTERLETYVSLTPQDIARQGMATSTGVAVSAATLKKLGAMTVAKTSAKLANLKAMGALASVASKLGLKSAAKAGALSSAGTGAASGAALCAITVAGAPLAPGCALVGGAITGLAAWLLVDKAVLETEELLHRETLEEELRQALTTLRDDLRTSLKARYVGAVNTGFNYLRNGSNYPLRPTTITPTKNFVPSRAAPQG